MYNHVTTEQDIACICGKILPKQYFQSKDMTVGGREQDLTLGDYKMEDIEDGEMHGGGCECEAHVQFNISGGKIVSRDIRYPPQYV